MRASLPLRRDRAAVRSGECVPAIGRGFGRVPETARGFESAFAVARGFGCVLAAALCAAAAVAASGAPLEPRLGVAYGASEATLDFYPPLASERAAKGAPLLAFIAGRFWGLEGGSADPLDQLVAAPLRAEGIAVALIRHRPAPQYTHPLFAQDAAAAVAWLVAHARELGVDPKRIFLAGHASGAQLAALLALDARYLEAHGLAPDVLAGVIPISGIYEVDPERAALAELADAYRSAFPTRELQRDASPLGHVGADAPPFLVLAAQHEIAGLLEVAAALSQKLRDAGHPAAETFIANGQDHRSVLDLRSDRNPARRHLLGYVGVGADAKAFRDTLAARSYWRKPSASTEPFWALAERIEQHPAQPRISALLRAYFASGGNRGFAIAPPRYAAIDLFALLDALGEPRTGRGRWLVLTNQRGERAVLELEALRAYGPQVVIGLDDERNLFRIVDLYQTQRRYTWRQPNPEPWILARPAGAFLYFETEPPPSVVPGLFGLFGLTLESFARTDSDPFAALADFDPADRNFLVRDKACLSCHRFRSAGARAGHIRARDGELVGGFALPLEEYPPEVWRRYCFDQLAVAAEIGANPVTLSPEWQQRLFDLVVQERERSQAHRGK